MLMESFSSNSVMFFNKSFIYRAKWGHFRFENNVEESGVRAALCDARNAHSRCEEDVR